jgi:hypothetical protein
VPSLAAHPQMLLSDEGTAAKRIVYEYAVIRARSAASCKWSVQLPITGLLARVCDRVECQDIDVYEYSCRIESLTNFRAPQTLRLLWPSPVAGIEPLSMDWVLSWPSWIPERTSRLGK